MDGVSKPCTGNCYFLCLREDSLVVFSKKKETAKMPVPVSNVRTKLSISATSSQCCMRTSSEAYLQKNLRRLKVTLKNLIVSGPTEENNEAQPVSPDSVVNVPEPPNEGTADMLPSLPSPARSNTYTV
ncbi:hypothetical protein PoB_006031700 [Plakobranchus ocellatus]|uniref:Uncharacterized protein n=1 Tax=Plakobranchus ocellatus TaxID=259542 RepID=A0AAV4CPI3_9GAST|nr:hypothetical protein PoB_006031700 [Plakobranchus ocellatus]